MRRCLPGRGGWTAAIDAGDSLWIERGERRARFVERELRAALEHAARNIRRVAEAAAAALVDDRR